ncbi:MAG: DUF177 domain-containing protein [Rhodospirillales bacterium]
MSTSEPKREFPSPVTLGHLGEDSKTFLVEADDAAREAIAARLDLASLEHLSANLTVQLDGDPDAPGTGAYVEGEVTGRGTQTCVVSLQPVPFDVKVAVQGLFLPADSSEFAREELTLDDDEVDVLGEIEAGSVDLGELAIQQLALELDPFPRAEGAEPEWRGDDGANVESAGNSPFAALAKLKDSLK